MRIFTSISLVFMSLLTLTAQKVIVNSPASLAGVKLFSAAAFGADLNSNVWTADVVFVNDGSANPSQGCNPLVNGNDIAGKIALVDRGSCEFGLKALNAETAGAIAVIIFNNAPGAGTIAPGAGAVGGQVTVPCVMLNYEDGQAFLAELANGAVNVSIGAIKGNYDLGSDVASILNAPNGTSPISQVKNAGDLVVVPGGIITNIGVNPVANATLAAKIDHTPFGGSATEVFNANFSAGTLQPDSTAFIILGDYDAGVNGTGYYEITYTITSDNPDDAGFDTDNTVSTNFTISENVYSKAKWDLANNIPGRTNAYTISGGGPIEFLAGFNVPNGIGYSLDSVMFYVSTALPSLDQVKIDIYAYEWNDLNADESLANDEISIAGFNTWTFSADDGTGGWFTLPLLDFNDPDFKEGVTINGNNKRYFIGVRYEGADLVYIGFDENYDLGPYLELRIANATLTDTDYPYLGINSWDASLPLVEDAFLFTGLRSVVATALFINEAASSTKDILTADQVEMKVYPNPVSDILVAEVDLKFQSAFLDYKVTDATGRVIFNTRAKDASEDKAVFRVSTLPNGQYFLSIRTDKGILTKPFNVNH